MSPPAPLPVSVSLSRRDNWPLGACTPSPPLRATELQWQRPVSGRLHMPSTGGNPGSSWGAQLFRKLWLGSCGPRPFQSLWFSRLGDDSERWVVPSSWGQAVCPLSPPTGLTPEHTHVGGNPCLDPRGPHPHPLAALEPRALPSPLPAAHFTGCDLHRQQGQDLEEVTVSHGRSGASMTQRGWGTERVPMCLCTHQGKEPGVSSYGRKGFCRDQAGT